MSEDSAKSKSSHQFRFMARFSFLRSLLRKFLARTSLSLMILVVPFFRMLLYFVFNVPLFHVGFI